METLLNETQVSQKLQVSLACLRRWRLLGAGPEYIKVGPLVRYRPEAIDRWVEALPTGGNGRRPATREGTMLYRSTDRFCRCGAPV
jgi:predicted DNA-binding transcriptional regulator AlpA